MRSPRSVSWKTEKAAFGLGTATIEDFTTIAIVMQRLFGQRLEFVAFTRILREIFGSDPSADSFVCAMA